MLSNFLVHYSLLGIDPLLLVVLHLKKKKGPKKRPYRDFTALPISLHAFYLAVLGELVSSQENLDLSKKGSKGKYTPSFRGCSVKTDRLF